MMSDNALTCLRACSQGGAPGDSSGRRAALLHLLSVSAAERVCGGAGARSRSSGDGHHGASAGPRQLRSPLLGHFPLRPSAGARGTRPPAPVRELRADLFVQTAACQLKRPRVRFIHGQLCVNDSLQHCPLVEILKMCFLVTKDWSKEFLLEEEMSFISVVAFLNLCIDPNSRIVTPYRGVHKYSPPSTLFLCHQTWN